MAKAARTFGSIIIGAGLILATAGAVLIPAAAGGGLAGALGTSLLGVSAGQMIAAGSLISSLGNRPEVGGSGGSAVDFQADPQAGVPYVVGETAVSGQIRFQTVTGEKNKYLSFYTVLGGGGPYESFGQFYAAGEPVSFTADGGEGAAAPYLNRMWLKKTLNGSAAYAGLRHTATGTKDTPADHGGNPPEWTTDHKFSGYAAYLLTIEYDANKFTSGPPKPLMVLKGAKVYDPRKDSTYPGGVGAHRWNDEATWTWSENPALHGLTWLIGRRQNGRRILGVGVSLTAIDVGAYIEAANVSDANGWKIGGVVYSTDDKYQVLTAMLQAGGAEPMRLGALISCFVNAPRVSLATLTGADIDGQATIAGTQSRRERFNRGIPRYRSPEHNWEIVPATPVVVDTYVTEDGGWRSREVDLPLVQDVDQAAQLTTYAIVNGREFGPLVLPVRPRWMGLKPGDCFTVNEPEFGLVGQKLIVRSRDRDPQDGSRVLTCRSETDAKHDFALGRTGVAPPTPGVTVPSGLPGAPGDDAWSVLVTTVIRGGVQVPVVVITGEVDDPNASEILAGYRLLDLDGVPSGGWVWTPWPAANKRIELLGLTPHAHYQIAVRYKTIRGVEDETVYLDLGEVEIPAMIVEATVAELDGVAAAEVVAAIRALGGYGSDLIVAAENRIADLEALINKTAIAAMQGSADERRHRAALAPKITVDGVDVSVFAEREQLQRIEGQTALAADITTLSATVGANQASAQVYYATFASADVAQTEARIALASTVGANKAAADLALGTLTTGLSAEASARLLLATTVGSNHTAVLAEISTTNTNLATQTSLLAALTSDFGSNSASVASQLSTLTTAQGATASSLSSLSSTVGGHSSSLTVYGAAIDGLKAQWGFSLNSDGQWAGLTSQLYGGRSSIDMLFNVLRLVDPAGGSAFPAWVYESGETRINGRLKAQKLIADSIETDWIKSGAATATITATADTPVADNSSGILLVEATMPVSGDTVQIVGYVAMHAPSSRDTVQFYVVRDNVQIGPAGRVSLDGQDEITVPVAFTDDQATPGNHTYSIYATPSNFQHLGRSISLLNVKKNG